MTKVIIISGSPSKHSRLTGLADYCKEILLSKGMSVEEIYPIDLPATSIMQADFSNPFIKEAVSKVAEADVVILASPVYKASYSGVLKTFLDLLPQKGLEHKIVFPLFIGGSIAHLLVINYALNPVVSALGGTIIMQGVYAVDQWIGRLEGGGFELNEEVMLRLTEALDKLMCELELRLGVSNSV